MRFRSSWTVQCVESTIAIWLFDLTTVLALTIGAMNASSRLTAQESTVSFSTSVAPILLENCKGCHIGGQQGSGGLRMDTFEQLMQGGDSGEIIQAGKASQSLIIGKLKGEAPGQRMPAGGRSPLTAEQIDVISSWIDRGAEFDGFSRTASIATIVQNAWASEASHSDLFKQRKEQARRWWQQVAPNTEPHVEENTELFAIGNVERKRLAEVFLEYQHAIENLKKQVKRESDEALIKGGLVLFVFKSRYDYSEFGRMVEKRELPKDWSGHWQADGVNAYMVLCDGSADNSSLDSLALHAVAGTFWGCLPQVPYWFAEGYARMQVASKFRKKDPRVNRWIKELPSAGQVITGASDLVNGKTDEETVGLAGMALAESMNSRTTRSKFQALLNQLLKGETFPDAMTRTFGKHEEFVKSWLGK